MAAASAPRLLFEPLSLAGGALRANNRVWMAPMTRLRNTLDSDLPTSLAVDYYTQRAGAGVIITEATNISPTSKGYSGTPGIWTPEQVAAWRRVTDSVHEAGGLIVCQLWHTGRISHPSVQPDGVLPISASAIDPKQNTTIFDSDAGTYTRAACPVPRAATKEDLEQVVKDFHHATKCAKEAGFDGVEIHGAHGYLLHQFLSPLSNTREDEFGGSLENRARFPLQVVDACIDAWDVSRVGIRLSPIGELQGVDNGPEAQAEADALWLLEQLNKRASKSSSGMLYLHLSEPDWVGAGFSIRPEFKKALRETWKGVLVTAGAYNVDKAEKKLASGLVDAVAFGRPFISNPDLVERFRVQADLSETDPATIYGQGAKGYSDYPAMPVINARDDAGAADAAIASQA